MNIYENIAKRNNNITQYQYSMLFKPYITHHVIYDSGIMIDLIQSDSDKYIIYSDILYSKYELLYKILPENIKPISYKAASKSLPCLLTVPSNEEIYVIGDCYHIGRKRIEALKIYSPNENELISMLVEEGKKYVQLILQQMPF